jgi:phosphoribosylformylglycinamidine cyclo-ligase
VLVVEAGVRDVAQMLEKAGESVFTIGRVEAGAKGCTVAGSRGTWSARGDWSAVHHG